MGHSFSQAMLYPESEIPYPESKIPYPEQRNFNALLMQHVKSKWVTHFHWRASTQNPKSCSPNPRSHTQNNVLLMHVSCSKLKSSASLIFTGEAAPRIRNPIFSILHSQNNVANFGTDVLLICRTCAHDFHTQSKYHATRINFPVPRVQPLTCRIVVCGLHVQQNSQPHNWTTTMASHQGANATAGLRSTIAADAAAEVAIWRTDNAFRQRGFTGSHVRTYTWRVP